MRGRGELKAVFVDANEALKAVMERLRRDDDLPIRINVQPDITPPELPSVLGNAEIAIVDHTHLPDAVADACRALKHVVFLGTGAASYMDVDALKKRAIEVHTIKGYGDTSVAECAIALMWASAKGLAFMDRNIRQGKWLRTNGIELRNKTLGLVGYGSIAAEVARIARGAGMRVVAWNRSPKTAEGVEFLPLDDVLQQSDVVSLHLVLDEETRNIISRDRIGQMKPGVILVNTARGALVDEDAMVEALRSGHIHHAGLDVFVVEPMKEGHVLTTLDNVTLSAHSAFRTSEASDNLINAALAHCRRITAAPTQRERQDQ
jgi:D-3-phosphoglycerate dehydrogenase